MVNYNEVRGKPGECRFAPETLQNKELARYSNSRFFFLLLLLVMSIGLRLTTQATN
jgi:hypothetical protein